MAKQSHGLKRYIVDLSGEERERLEALTKRGKTSAEIITRARILLLADVSDAGPGWTDARIIEALGTGHKTVETARKRLVEEGLEALLARKKSPDAGVKRIFDGQTEARLIKLACSAPPPGHARWSIRLLEREVGKAGVVERASDTTIQRVLKKTKFSLTSRNTG